MVKGDSDKMYLLIQTILTHTCIIHLYDNPKLESVKANKELDPNEVILVIINFWHYHIIIIIISYLFDEKICI